MSEAVKSVNFSHPATGMPTGTKRGKQTLNDAALSIQGAFYCLGLMGKVSILQDEKSSGDGCKTR